MMKRKVAPWGLCLLSACNLFNDLGNAWTDRGPGSQIRLPFDVTKRRERVPSVWLTLLVIGSSLMFASWSRAARADSTVEVAGSAGFGAIAAGLSSARFAISPSASLSLRGDHWFFVGRDTLSLLGASGGRFGIDNETTVGGGHGWDFVSLSAGLSLVAYSLPICGARLCGPVRGVAPGTDVRLDIFGPYLSGALGISIDCAGAWITGRAAAVWTGVAGRCSAGPVFRFSSRG
jgi:hypothetical protein